MKTVGVVILNYKVRIQLKKCVEDVKKSTHSVLKIYVVDNNSKDGSEDDFKDDKSVTFIQTGSNKGYSGGNNMGVKKALEDGCDFIFVLNPDTEIDRYAIEHLVGPFADDSIGITGPKIYFLEGEKKTCKKIWFAGGVFDALNVYGVHKGVNQIDNGQFEKKEKSDFITGAAIMIRKEVFERIGLFDEDFFLYYEDTDFCLRASGAGFKILLVPQAIVYHANAQSTGLGSGLQDYFITRNRMLLASKFLSWRTRFALFREGLRNAGNKTRRIALIDFLLGRLGKGSFIHD